MDILDKFNKYLIDEKEENQDKAPVEKTFEYGEKLNWYDFLMKRRWDKSR